MEKSLKKPKKVLILGSGALKIGEAGEFDYSGSQAVKAIREEGIHTVIVNPNIATIQTSPNFADKIYFLPVTPYFVEKIIAREKPDGILLGFGGQTALNCGLDLEKSGILKKYNVKVLGTPISAILKTEDRLLFRKSIESMGLKVPKSVVIKHSYDIKKISQSIIFPVIVRAGFSLGGLGSGVAHNLNELETISKKALNLTSQILIEEYLDRWKEVEYEVVRDSKNNTIVVCNMENFDPMGIHTGESIVVSPSQTLNNREYHFLREIAIRVVKSLPIVGECNIQFALSAKNDDYRIIEVNARLSRSSALASKATGYPLAYVAAKLALGYNLPEIKNAVTQATCAFFEPALDYVVVKIPRWDFLKFKDYDELIGSEMQSVGEVMAIGRTFEEALQKAIRSLDINYEGIISDDLDIEKVLKTSSRGRSSYGRKYKIKYKDLLPTPSRPYNIAYNLYFGQSIKLINQVTGIDTWFIERIKNIVDFYKNLIIRSKSKILNRESLDQAKKMGFSDVQLAEIFNLSFEKFRKIRKDMKILPRICQVDTLAAEFPAKTNYLYFSYHRETDDIKQNTSKQVIIIGGGPYQIGSSVEFDWCAVNCVQTVKKMGYKPIMINCNPETVSTDYDISEKLYFEELTLERVLDILDYENCPVIVSVGGQKPNNLAKKLASNKITILGNKPEIIDRVEDREKFSALLDKLSIQQPIWNRLKSSRAALNFAKRIGYPVLVRPSYVLSGRAMLVAYSENVLKAYLKTSSAVINPEYPVVISKFIRGAKEIDFDAVVQKGMIKLWAISEHVEHAGVHSGDSTLVLPSFSLSQDAIDVINEVSVKIAKNLPVNGPINLQFLVNEDGRSHPEVLVIEGNLRASRSFPFVSKVLGVNFIEMATRIMLGQSVSSEKIKQPDYYGVKVPHFSFTRLRQVDPVLRVEMASTGEVACFGNTLQEAYLKALLSTGVELPNKTALISLGGDEGKRNLLNACKLLFSMGYTIYATDNTAKYFKLNGIKAAHVYKVHDDKKPNVVDLIKQKKVKLVINISDRSDLGVKELSREVTDGYLIRRAAVDANIPLFTKNTIANLFIKSIYKYSMDKLEIKSWDEYIKKTKN